MVSGNNNTMQADTENNITNKNKQSIKNVLGMVFAKKSKKYKISVLIALLVFFVSFVGMIVKISYAATGTGWSWGGYSTDDTTYASSDERGFHTGYFYINLFKNSTRWQSATIKGTVKDQKTNNSNAQYKRNLNKDGGSNQQLKFECSTCNNDYIVIANGNTSQYYGSASYRLNNTCNEGGCDWHAYVSPNIKIKAPKGYKYGGYKIGYNSYYNDSAAWMNLYNTNNYGENNKLLFDSSVGKTGPYANDTWVSGYINLSQWAMGSVTREGHIHSREHRTFQSYSVKFVPNTTTIKFNGNGSSGSMSNQTKSYDTALTLRANSFAKTGYTFTKWCTQANGGGTCYNNKSSLGAQIWPTTTSITLYAQWTANTTTIIYNAGGGDGAPSNQTKTYGVVSNISSTIPTRQGYEFVKWCTGSDGSGDCYNPSASLGAQIWPTTTRITLYAQWKNQNVLVHYNANGGTGSMADQTLTVYVDKLNPNTFTRSNYVFGGWSTTSNGIVEYSDGQYFTPNNAPIQDEITLYAKWLPGSAIGNVGDCNWIFNSDTGALTIFPPDDLPTCEIYGYEFGDHPWSEYYDDILSVYVVNGVAAGAYGAGIFSDLTNATIIDISNMDLSMTKNLTGFFDNCNHLEHLDLGNVVYRLGAIFDSSYNNKHFFKNAGKLAPNGMKITINSELTEQQRYPTLQFPWNYYVIEEEDGELGDQIFTPEDFPDLLTGLQVATFVPVFGVQFDKGSGTSLSGDPNPMILRIGEAPKTTSFGNYSATKSGNTLSSWNSNANGMGVSIGPNESFSYIFRQAEDAIDTSQTDGEFVIDDNDEKIINVTNGIATLYAQYTPNRIATFYYQSNTTSGQTTIASKTASCSGTTCKVIIPEEVRNSVGTYNNSYGGLATSTGTMSGSVTADLDEVTISGNQTFYAVYSSEVENYYYEEDEET